jgi:phage gpG-like protein
VTVRVTVDTAVLAEVRAAFDRLAKAGQDATPAWSAIGQLLVASTTDRFRSLEGPGGVPWKPSIRAIYQGGVTLTDTARLRGSITYRAEASGVEVGSNVLYAAIHQFGGVIRAKTAKGLRFFLPAGAMMSTQKRIKGDRKRNTFMVIVRQVTIPARPFLGVSQADREDIQDLLEAHIRRALGSTAA